MYHIQKLTPRHHEILTRHLAGESNKDIAAALNITPQIVSILVNSPNFQHELAKRRGVVEALANDKLSDQTNEAEELLRKNALRAASALVEGLDEESFSNRKNSATEILDRVGVGKINKIDATVKGAVVHLSKDDAEAITETLKMVS